MRSRCTLRKMWEAWCEEATGLSILMRSLKRYARDSDTGTRWSLGARSWSPGVSETRTCTFRRWKRTEKDVWLKKWISPGFSNKWDNRKPSSITYWQTESVFFSNSMTSTWLTLCQIWTISKAQEMTLWSCTRRLQRKIRPISEQSLRIVSKLNEEARSAACCRDWTANLRSMLVGTVTARTSIARVLDNLGSVAGFTPVI